VSRRERAQAGFTLLEVMLGLALMGLAIVVLIKSTAGNIFSSEEAHMMGVATDLARGKMYDIEEVLLKDGFTDTSQSQESEECFTDEGWPNICYSYKVEEPKLPSFDELQNMTMKKAEAMAGSAGSGSGSAGLSGSAGDMLAQAGSGALGGGGALGGMLGMVGMFGGSQDIDAAQGGAMIQGQYAMFQEVLKVSVRKVILTVKWKVLGRDRDMTVVAFFTDPGAMNKTMLGGMTNALEASGGGDSGTGSGSGSGSGSSSGGSSSGRPPRGGKGTTP
jgi:general secretion pathway protein I